MSASILERLNAEAPQFGTRAGDLQITNFPYWPEGETRTLPPTALTAKILCQRHNNALSLLDSEAVRFFGALDDMALEFMTSEHMVHRLDLFNGHDIERWLLKVLSGLCGFGEARMFPGKQTDVSLPTEWLEALFGLRNFSAGQGLYSPRTIGKTIESIRGLALAPFAHEGRLIGLMAQMHSFELRLTMRPAPGQVRNFLGDVQAYRPLEFACTDGNSDKNIIFSWDIPGDGGTIHILNRNPPTTGT